MISFACEISVQGIVVRVVPFGAPYEEETPKAENDPPRDLGHGGCVRDRGV